jgi:heme A synthase
MSLKTFSMTPDSLFQLCSAIAFIGWLILIIGSPFILEIDKFLVGVIITLLAIVYTWLIFSSFQTGDIKKFGTLDGVMNLFQHKTLVTAGWVHYLAFDLLVGIWIKRNGVKYGINHWMIIPCLLFTFMLGPAGLLLYLLIRMIKTRHYFSASF